MIVINEKNDVPSELFQSLYEKWLSSHDGDSVPHKEKLGADFLGDMAGFCKVIEFEPPEMYKYVVIGDALKRLYGDEIEGKYVDEVFDLWIRKNVKESYDKTREIKQPVYVSKKFSTMFGEVGYEYILFPYTNAKDGSVDVILSYVFPIDRHMQEYSEWRNAIDATSWLNK